MNINIGVFILTGLPEFDFPTLDPLFYEYGKVVFNSGEIRAEVILLNTTAVGLSKAHFKDVRLHFFDDVFHLEVDTQTPRILIQGAVKMDGSLGAFRIAGEGTIINCTQSVNEHKNTFYISPYIMTKD